ncbi:MAG: kynureninase [Flavobacteriales bacterium]|nr:kynureninase [Flavobacteriales bacterium]
MHFEDSLDFAVSLDHYDELAGFRKEFHIPRMHGRDAIYFTGNSLGLQPIKARDYVLQELEDWKNLGVEGHLHAKNPWFSYHEPFKELLSGIVGAKPEETVAMGSLTANLHFLLVSFYRPTRHRFRILCEKKSFPSDYYALDSQVRYHGFEPADAVIEIGPREGESIIRTEDILQTIEQYKESLALVMLGGVNYYTGQWFDIKTITEAAHRVGAFAGYDLAHAVGNVPLSLHDWQVDFAAWCSYKYLNSGPGGVAGIFVHEKHCKNKNIPRFEGWWGNKPNSRFKMERTIDAFETAEAWQLSNAPVLSMAPHRAALEIFSRAGMDKLRNKSVKLTGYLEYRIQKINEQLSGSPIQILTPADPSQRGCQLSLEINGGKKVFDQISEKGVVADWREPSVIRVAPVPLYNTFRDVYEFSEILLQALKS